MVQYNHRFATVRTDNLHIFKDVLLRSVMQVSLPKFGESISSLFPPHMKYCCFSCGFLRFCCFQAWKLESQAIHQRHNFKFIEKLSHYWLRPSTFEMFTGRTIEAQLGPTLTYIKKRKLEYDGGRGFTDDYASQCSFYQQSYDIIVWCTKCLTVLCKPYIL